MPDATRLAGNDFSWHDDVLVNRRFADLGGERPELLPIPDLYPVDDPKPERKTHLCATGGPSRLFMKGDIPRLVKNTGSGNIDVMRMNFTADTKIVVVLLIRGMLEFEARTFTLAELGS